MQKIIGLLKSPATSISSSDPFPSGPSSKLDLAASQPQQYPLGGRRSHMAPCLQNLPAEIIQNILAYLPPVSLAAVIGTSKQLRPHAQNELLWMQLVKDNVPEETPLPSSAPAKSWKDLYAAHHPYWFLTRHKIWFSDKQPLGCLVIARYDFRRGCIEGYQLLARHGQTSHLIERWEHNLEVRIHPFNPEVNLMLDDPVIKLDLDRKLVNRLSGEVKMQTGRTPGIASMLSLCKAIQPARLDPSMALWPPGRIPSLQRVRNQSSTQFRTDTHRPKKIADASDQTFRLRKFLQWSNMMHPMSSVRMGEHVSTFSTLLEESYIPTESKPYQGIWVGDYSAHGCEFLLVMQTDHPPETDVSRRSSSDSGMLPSGLAITPREVRHPSSDAPAHDFSTISSQGGELSGDAARTAQPSQPYRPSGRIEAIKLTGDVNVPRGECTWFADDIGEGGLIRVADEERFRGARIVKSMGQVASQQFKHNRYIDSQLILISHDTVAQHWERFGHISFYKRVDIDNSKVIGARNEADAG